MTTKFRTLRRVVTFIFSFAVIGTAWAQLDVRPDASIDIDPPPGQTRVVSIHLSNNSGTIDSYGFTLTYPPSILTYTGTDVTGTLTENWNSSGGNEPNPGSGEVIIGGFNPSNNGGGFTDASGVVIKVLFTDTGASGSGLIQLSNFSADFAGGEGNETTTAPGVINNTVPVELVSFSAQVSSDAVTLTWLTSSESNNFGFDVEKSFDNELFSKIGFVRGNGTTLEPNSYEFTDSNLDRNLPVRYYRLKQVDNDGSFTYSGVLTVQLANPENFVLKQNYPNPFNPETTISYELPQPSRISLIIYNLQGQVIRNLLDQEMSAGFHSVQWNGKDHRGIDVSSGVYIYEMTANGYKEVKRLSLIR